MIINANLFEVEEDKLQTPLPELLNESKRLPDICVFLRATEENVLKRVFNQKEVVDKYNALMEERRLKKEEERQQRLAEIEKQREEALANGEEFEEPQLEEENDADDPEAPNLEAMIAEAKEKFTTAREAQLSKIEEVSAAFEELGIKIVIIDTDKSIEDVFKNITFKLRDTLEKRSNIFEKFQITDLDEFSIAKYDKSYVYKKGKYMDGNIVTPWAIPKKKEIGLAYRNRIFFCKDEEERNAIKENLREHLAKLLPAPKDTRITTKVFVIGKPKSGKTTLAKKLQEKLGLVHIKVKHLLNRVREDPFWLLAEEVNKLMRDGKTPSNEHIVRLINKRVQMADCVERGWVLDDFPRTKEQAQLLTEAGLIPDLVFDLTLDEKTILERATKNKEKSEKFGYDRRIIHDRLKEIEKGQTDLELYYIDTFDNLRYLDSKVSKWGVFDSVKLIG